nr:hypothetical protein [Candidatus Sigynarchaeota archaeon]
MDIFKNSLGIYPLYIPVPRMLHVRVANSRRVFGTVRTRDATNGGEP